MLVNDRDTSETALIKKLSNDVKTKPLQKCMQQYVERNAHKHHLMSEVTNGEAVQKRTYLIRQFNFDKSKLFASQDPLPRCTLARRVTVEFMEHDGKMCLVTNYDCRCIERESQTFRHVKHVMRDTPTLESFRPICFKSYP